MDKQDGGQVHAGQAAFAKACEQQRDIGDLRGTSQGDIYPLAAIMYQHDNRTAWFLEDLQKGLVLCAAGKPIACGGEFAARGLAGGGVGHWREGRPGYDINAERWLLQTPSNPVRVVRLHSMLHRNAS